MSQIPTKKPGLGICSTLWLIQAATATWRHSKLNTKKQETMKRSKLFLLIGILTIIATGCNIPTPAAIAHLLVPNGSATPTPFQPSGADDDLIPTMTVDPNASATPTIIPLLSRLPRPSGQVNILLFGSDFRPNSGYRTDVIMMLSLDTKNGTASLVSFPRDLYVDIPGWEMQRINTAQAHGGFELTQKTFEKNFGVHPDHYIMTNFDGFKSAIDTLGGIDIVASRAFSDKCDLSWGKGGYCSVDAGQKHLDGASALWYARARYSTDDFDRTRRGQEVVLGVFYKLMSLNAVERAPELYNVFKGTVETDMSLTDMVSLLPMAPKLTDTSRIKRYAVSRDLITPWKTEMGAQVLIPNTEAIWEKVIKPAFYNQ